MKVKNRFVLVAICIVYFSACSKKGDVIYIKMPNNPVIAESRGERVRFHGGDVGEIKKKLLLGSGFILLMAEIDGGNKYSYTSAIYREDLLGNRFIELFGGEPEPSVDSELAMDTIIGSYAQLYREVDSGSRNKILKELGSIKMRLDSILGNK